MIRNKFLRPSNDQINDKTFDLLISSGPKFDGILDFRAHLKTPKSLKNDRRFIGLDEVSVAPFAEEIEVI